jgi:uncharacterized protein (DUF58 family)
MGMNLWHDRRLRLSITRLGFQYMLAMLAIGAFAVNSGNNLLYLTFSLMLGLFLVSGFVSRAALRGVDLAGIDEGNLFARVRGGLRVRLKDRAPKRVRGLELHLEMENGKVEPGFLGGGQGGEEVLVVLHARAEARGWTKVTSLELRTSLPFGFLEKAWRISLDRPVLVLPHPRTSPSLPPGELGEVKHTLPTPGTTSPDNARPYRTGDAPSRVHWKRTAQRGALWVRTFEGERPLGLHLRLDLTRWPPGRPFEKELERLSGAILQARLQRKEVALELVSREARRSFHGHTDCWRALALAQAEAPGDTPAPVTDPAATGAQALTGLEAALG